MNVQSHEFSAEKNDGFMRNSAIVDALTTSYATIEFQPDGTIITANQKFLDALGYRLDEIRGRHHRIFVAPGEAATPQYATFWNRIASGEVFSGVFKRVRKDGEEIWILATYNPIYNREGRLVSAFKLAIDVTEEKRGHLALARAVERLAGGDINARVTETLTGDFDALKTTYNGMVDRLSSTLSAFEGGAQRLDAVSDDLNGNAQGLSGRAERLAAAIEQSNATVASLSSAVEDVASRAGETEGVIRETSRMVSNGREVAASAVEAMKRIETMTEEISKITKVIESFAFQTNLLSINAAVEAARAGEAGKGFAVVAAEVRSLAERSAGASRDIAGLIERSKKEVSAGASLVNEAGGALAKVDTSMTTTVASFVSISEGARSQASGMGEIRTALGAMQAETNAVANMADANGRWAAELRDEAGKMGRRLGEFLGHA